MNITRETIKDTLRTVMAEETEYQIFFKKALEKAGKSIPSMSDEEKKEFFNKIDAAWNAKGEKKEVKEVHLREGMKKWKVDFKHTDGSKRTVDIEAFDKNRAKARFKVNWGNDMKILKIYPATKNEELHGNQHKLDVDGDGEIEASDLAKLRKKKDESVNEARTVSKPIKVDNDTMVQIVGDNKGFRELTAALNPKTGKPIQKFGFDRGNEIADSKEELIKKLQKKYGKSIKFESVNESAGCGCGCGCGGSKMNEEFKSKDSTFEKVYGTFDKRDYFNAKGLAKVQIGNFERALQRNDKGAQQILDKFKGDMGKAKDYITQVITDRRKEQAFNDYKAFKVAVDSIQKGKPQYGAVDLVKRRIHNNSQKYTIALYSALRNKKFTKWKDVHADVDSLIGEAVKLSEELAFEINTFLERPVLSKNEITLEKSEIKDVVTLLVKEGFQKRLSSGVKREFIELLKKNK